MSDKNHLVTVTIFDREYSIKCPVQEASQLQEAAKILDAQMRSIRQNNNANIERIAVVTALNLSHELALLKQQIANLSAKIRKSIVTEEEIGV